MEQTDSCQRGAGRRDCMKECEEFSQKNNPQTHHICMTHGQQCGDSQEERRVGMGGQRRGEWGHR